MKHSNSEIKLLKNPFTDSIRSETVDSLTKKNIALTKELSKMKLEMENLKNLISRMSEEKEYYINKISQKDRTFMSDNELNQIQRIKSENEQKIKDLETKLENKNNENNELIKQIEDLKSQSNKMTVLYNEVISKMDKFIEACNKC